MNYENLNNTNSSSSNISYMPSKYMNQINDQQQQQTELQQLLSTSPTAPYKIYLRPSNCSSMFLSSPSHFTTPSTSSSLILPTKSQSYNENKQNASNNVRPEDIDDEENDENNNNNNNDSKSLSSIHLIDHQNDNNINNNNKCKRPRTKFTKEQTEILETAFSKTQYPNLIIIETLSNLMQLSPERISVWFQNKRARFKKFQKQELIKQEEIEKTNQLSSTFKLPIIVNNEINKSSIKKQYNNDTNIMKPTCNTNSTAKLPITPLYNDTKFYDRYYDNIYKNNQSAITSTQLQFPTPSFSNCYIPNSLFNFTFRPSPMNNDYLNTMIAHQQYQAASTFHSNNNNTKNVITSPSKQFNYQKVTTSPSYQYDSVTNQVQNNIYSNNMNNYRSYYYDSLKADSSSHYMLQQQQQQQQDYLNHHYYNYHHNNNLNIKQQY